MYTSINLDSYLIISRDRNRITKKDFVDFVTSCLDKGFESIFKIFNFEHLFQKSFMDWVSINRPLLIGEIEKVFI